MSLLNDNHGVVSWVSPDRTTIKIRLPRGGSVKAPNAGFEMGDVVAFTLNPVGDRVLKVMPKYVADLAVEIGRNRLLQAALIEEEVSDEHNWNANGIEEDCPYSRPSLEECPDLYGAEYRGDVEEWADHLEYSFEPYVAPWTES